MNHAPNEAPHITRFREELARFDENETPPGLLYHYTTADGFLGITQSGWMRATSISCMNDPAEWVYGQQIILSCAEELKRHASPGSLARRWLDEVAFHEVGNGFDAYVVAFSEDGDSLPQWRAYGDDSAGLALGIDQSLVRQSLWWVRVTYEPDVQRAGALERLGAVTGLLNEAERRGPRSESEDLLAAALEVGPSWIAPYQVSMKPSAWSYEREWRAVRLSTDYFGAKSPDLRVRAGKFIPFVDRLVPIFFRELDETSALREVVLGPLRDMKSDSRVLREFLGSQLAIKPSVISYRR